jgi:hypothetical protein
MRETFIEVANRINEAIKTHEVIGYWDNDNGFVVIAEARYESREDGDHLLAYDKKGTGYCIGNAVVRNSIGVYLWNAGNTDEKESPDTENEDDENPNNEATE